MNYRRLGKTNLRVSEISLGTWQVGGKWGSAFDHSNADDILHAAIDHGVNFIDTADVYGNRESEKAVGRLVRDRSEQVYVATKCGRRLSPHVNEAYTPAAMRGFVEDSLTNMGLEHIDLIQLHCPVDEVFDRPEIFRVFEDLKQEGKIGHLGVSVEKIAQAMKAMEYDNVTTIQIIFNAFRQRPSELFFEEAKKRDVGILARVPLASGLLTGKFGHDTVFKAGDHRLENRNGEQFDKGETFSGVDYATGLKAVQALEKAFPGKNLAQLALNWILMFDEISCVIPGASRVSQVVANVQAVDAEPLTSDELDKVRGVYEVFIKEGVHHLW